MSICDNCRANTLCGSRDVGEPETMVSCVGYIPPEPLCYITDVREQRMCGFNTKQTYFLSCGHKTEKRIGERFNFCEQCGARVVGRDAV